MGDRLKIFYSLEMKTGCDKAKDNALYPDRNTVVSGRIKTVTFATKMGFATFV